MRLKNSIDYKRFPEPSRGDWTRFTILVLSATLLGPCSRLRKQLAVFVVRRTGSLLTGRRITKTGKRSDGPAAA